MGREALLGRILQIEGHGPLRQPGTAAFQDAVGRDGEVLAAGLVGAAVAAFLLGRVMGGAAAMGADRAIGPAGGFEPCAGGGFIVKAGFGEKVHRGRPWSPEILAFVSVVSST